MNLDLTLNLGIEVMGELVKSTEKRVGQICIKHFFEWILCYFFKAVGKLPLSLKSYHIYELS